MMLAGGASMVYHFMCERGRRPIMRHPQVSASRPTAACSLRRRRARIRAATATTRGFLANTCARRHVISLEEAIRKMTSLPAQQFQFREPRSGPRRLRRRPRRLRSRARGRHRDVREAPRVSDRHPLRARQRCSGGEERAAHGRAPRSGAREVADGEKIAHETWHPDINPLTRSRRLPPARSPATRESAQQAGAPSGW